MSRMDYSRAKCMYFPRLSESTYRYDVGGGLWVRFCVWVGREDGAIVLHQSYSIVRPFADRIGSGVVSNVSRVVTGNKTYRVFGHSTNGHQLVLVLSLLWLMNLILQRHLHVIFGLAMCLICYLPPMLHRMPRSYVRIRC